MLFTLAAACAGPRDQFIAGRVADRCDSQWPVCDQIAGCLIGNQSYVEGKFPGSNKIALQLFEPSTVKAYFYVENTAAAGTETAIDFYEDRCRSRVRQTVSGNAFLGEAQQLGYVVRSADLTGVGDHLIEFESDAKGDYLFKLEIVPSRLQEGQ